MFLAPAGGAIEGWQAAFVFGALLVFVMVFAGIRMLYLGLYEQSYDWRTSKSLKFLIAAVPVLIGLTIWYRIDSHDLWVARADAQAGVEYLVEAFGEDQNVEVDTDHFPIPFMAGSPGRPTRQSRPCEAHPFAGAAEVFTPALDGTEEREVTFARQKAALEQVKATLEAEGWESFLSVQNDGRRVSVTSFRAEKNLSYALASSRDDPNIDVIRISANSLCRE